MKHIPVLIEEVIEFLRPRSNESFIDATVGQGGHAKEILEHTLPGGKLLAFERDSENLKTAKKNLSKYSNRITFINDSFAHIKSHAYDNGFSKVNGILLDIGFSSYHVEDNGRGFSFMADGPLDMRYDTTQGCTAAQIINTYSIDELTNIFQKFGEERQATNIAQAISKARKHKEIETTYELVEVVESVKKRFGRIHPATQVFQALRIETNDELGQLEQALPDAIELLKPGGRIAIITFHSLEDRIVKRFFKKQDGQGFKIVNKHVIIPTKTEIKINPRSRSAKLRVLEKL
ncbi:MAG: 16S rRNA (cytosine(1402)-N(4))-methyltransferase RsmH [Patescibacteria group bacterium]